MKLQLSQQVKSGGMSSLEINMSLINKQLIHLSDLGIIPIDSVLEMDQKQPHGQETKPMENLTTNNNSTPPLIIKKQLSNDCIYPIRSLFDHWLAFISQRSRKNRAKKRQQTIQLQSSYCQWRNVVAQQIRLRLLHWEFFALKIRRLVQCWYRTTVRNGAIRAIVVDQIVPMGMKRLQFNRWKICVRKRMEYREISKQLIGSLGARKLQGGFLALLLWKHLAKVKKTRLLKVMQCWRRYTLEREKQKLYEGVIDAHMKKYNCLCSITKLFVFSQNRQYFKNVFRSICRLRLRGTWKKWNRVHKFKAFIHTLMHNFHVCWVKMVVESWRKLRLAVILSIDFNKRRCILMKSACYLSWKKYSSRIFEYNLFLANLEVFKLKASIKNIKAWASNSRCRRVTHEKITLFYEEKIVKKAWYNGFINYYSLLGLKKANYDLANRHWLRNRFRLFCNCAYRHLKKKILIPKANAHFRRSRLTFSLFAFQHYCKLSISKKEKIAIVIDFRRKKLLQAVIECLVSILKDGHCRRQKLQISHKFYYSRTIRICFNSWKLILQWSTQKELLIRKFSKRRFFHRWYYWCTFQKKMTYVAEFSTRKLLRKVFVYLINWHVYVRKRNILNCWQQQFKLTINFRRLRRRIILLKKERKISVRIQYASRKHILRRTFLLIMNEFKWNRCSEFLVSNALLQSARRRKAHNFHLWIEFHHKQCSFRLFLASSCQKRKRLILVKWKTITQLNLRMNACSDKFTMKYPCYRYSIPNFSRYWLCWVKWQKTRKDLSLKLLQLKKTSDFRYLKIHWAYLLTMYTIRIVFKTMKSFGANHAKETNFLGKRERLCRNKRIYYCKKSAFKTWTIFIKERKQFVVFLCHLKKKCGSKILENGLKIQISSQFFRMQTLAKVFAMAFVNPVKQKFQKADNFFLYNRLPVLLKRWGDIVFHKKQDCLIYQLKKCKAKLFVQSSLAQPLTVGSSSGKSFSYLFGKKNDISKNKQSDKVKVVSRNSRRNEISKTVKKEDTTRTLGEVNSVNGNQIAMHRKLSTRKRTLDFGSNQKPTVSCKLHSTRKLSAEWIPTRKEDFILFKVYQYYFDYSSKTYGGNFQAIPTISEKSLCFYTFLRDFSLLKNAILFREIKSALNSVLSENEKNVPLSFDAFKAFLKVISRDHFRRSYSCLMKEILSVINNCMKDSANVETVVLVGSWIKCSIPVEMLSKEFVKVIEKYRKPLKTIFFSVIYPYNEKSEAKVQDKKSFLKFCKNYNLSPCLLSRKETLEIFESCTTFLHENRLYFSGFIESLAKFSLRLYSGFVLNLDSMELKIRLLLFNMDKNGIFFKGNNSIVAKRVPSLNKSSLRKSSKSIYYSTEQDKRINVQAIDKSKTKITHSGLYSPPSQCIRRMDYTTSRLGFSETVTDPSSHYLNEEKSFIKCRIDNNNSCEMDIIPSLDDIAFTDNF